MFKSVNDDINKTGSGGPNGIDATSICPWYSADADHVSLGCCYGWTQALNSG
ncbi:hypothetical protein C365_06669 [Cryptococcus neoformans Bt85]|nr:hypothetical protein C365_06669 [Cryptococcus neoformans var. grubii Bt85]